MGAVSSSNQVIPEDLGKALILSDVRNTIFASRLRKGEQLEAMEYSWPITKMGARRTDPIPENKDVDAFEGDEQKKLWNRAQRFWRTPRVTVIAEKVLRNPDLSKGKYNKLVTKYVKEQKRDIEKVLLSDQDSNEDSGLVGSRFLGMGRVINNTAATIPLAYGDSLTAIPDDYQTPKAQIYNGVLADFDEEDFTDMMKSRADLLGTTGEFTLFAGTTLKRHINDFGNYRPNKDGYTVVVRTETQAIDKRKFQASVVDIYEGEFGIFDVEAAYFMPAPERGYGVDMEQVEMRPLMYCDHTELEYRGGGRSGLIDSILGYQYGDPRADFKIAPSDETVPDLEGH